MTDGPQGWPSVVGSAVFDLTGSEIGQVKGAFTSSSYDLAVIGIQLASGDAVAVPVASRLSPGIISASRIVLPYSSRLVASAPQVDPSSDREAIVEAVVSQFLPRIGGLALVASAELPGNPEFPYVPPDEDDEDDDDEQGDSR